VTANKNTRTDGVIGEEYAVWLLKMHGYKILERNYRTKLGEIDIIAIDPVTRSTKAQSRLERSRKAKGSLASSLRVSEVGDNGTLVFVEVKTRWSKKYGKPEEAVTQRKLSRIKRNGQLYIMGKTGLPKKLRIDVVAIEAEKGNILSAKIIRVT